MCEFNRVLKEKGILAFDDWVITEKADSEDRALLKHDWVSSDWITDNRLIAIVEDNGFYVEKMKEYTLAGRGAMKKYFADTFENYFRPQIISSDESWGESIANHFRQAVDRTIDFYVAGKMKYLQFVARKK